MHRDAKLRVAGRVLLVIGGARWLGLCIAAGPVFAEGSLVLMASGAAILSLGKRAPTEPGNA